MTNPTQEGPAKPRRDFGRIGLLALFAAAFAVIVGAVAFYLGIGGLEHWEWDKRAKLGDALAPVAALLNSLALFAALWSVHLQRVEMKENRDVMEKHAGHAERLANSQEQLAKAQEEANELTRRGHVVQVGMQLSNITRGLVEVGIAKAQHVTGPEGLEMAAAANNARTILALQRDQLLVLIQELGGDSLTIIPPKLREEVENG